MKIAIISMLYYYYSTFYLHCNERSVGPQKRGALGNC